jgi:hypothetical protein
MTKHRADLGDPQTAPIRTYAEVAAEMRRRGDTGITTGVVYWLERSAFRKLKWAMYEMEGDLDG